MRWASWTCLIVLTLAAAAGASRAQAPATQASALGARYNDEFSGFSLRPPLGTERQLRTSPRLLAQWVQRDEKTQAIRYVLEVLRIRQEPTKLKPAEYAQAVAAELSKSTLQVQSTQLGTVAGKPAMHFRGPAKDKLGRWARQTWVQLAPDQQLVLNISGPITDQDELDATLTAVADSLQLFDPSAARTRRQESLVRGAEVLGKLDKGRLKAMAAERPYYFLLALKGKPIGFLKVSESIERRWEADGLWVVRLGGLTLPNQPLRLTREESFATPDRSFERWRRTVIEGEGPAAATTVSEAVREKDTIVLQLTRPGGPIPAKQRRIPEQVVPAYLPQAFDVLAGRLVERGKAGSYGFAVHNASANDFDLRTIEVVGEETIDVDGKKVQAVHLRDQMALDAPAVDVWVDAEGLPLRSQSPEGVTMERAGEKAVVARFGSELRELEKLESPADR